MRVILRIAVWDRRLIPSSLLVVIWLLNVGFLLHGIVTGVSSPLILLFIGES